MFISVCTFSDFQNLLHNFQVIIKLNNYVISTVVLIVYCIYVKINNINFKEIMLDIAVVTICFIVSFNSQSNIFHMVQNTFFYTISFFYICAPCTSFKKIVKIFVLTISTAVFIHVVFSQIGYLKDYLYYRFDMVAHSFGFFYYTHINFYLFFVWIGYVYLRGENITWAELVAGLAGGYLLYYFTTLRLTFYLHIIVFVVIVLVIKLNIIKLNWKTTQIFTLIGFGTMSAAAVISAVIYDPTIMLLKKINSMLSGRIGLGLEAFNRYNIKLFGQTIIQESSPNYFFLDCGYLYQLLGSGVVLFVLIIIAYTFMHYYSCKTNNKTLFVWITAIMIFTFINDAWVNICYTPTLLGTKIFFKDLNINIKQ